MNKETIKEHICKGEKDFRSICKECQEDLQIFEGQIWFKDEGTLTDKFIIWLGEYKKHSKKWGKQCELIIKLKPSHKTGSKSK